MKETYLVIHLFSGTMVISDENETEGCHYAEVSGLDKKKRQPEKVTVACPVFPLSHGRFTAVSALAAAAQRDAGRLCECCRYAGPFRIWFFVAYDAYRYQSAAVAGRAAQLYWRGEAGEGELEKREGRL